MNKYAQVRASRMQGVKITGQHLLFTNVQGKEQHARPRASVIKYGIGHTKM